MRNENSRSGHHPRPGHYRGFHGWHRAEEVHLKVATNATKVDVARAAEELFGVKVAKVNTISVRGRFRRQGAHAGYTASSKKAIVTLTKDSKGIDFFESMV